MQQHKLRELLQRYASGTCTKQEQKLVEDMVMRNPSLSKWEWNSEEERVMMGIRIKQSIDEKRFGKPRATVRNLWFWAAAASLAVALGVALHFGDNRLSRSTDTLLILEAATFADDGIRLILADGTIVTLDSVGNPSLGDTEGVKISMPDKDQLVYESAETNLWAPAAVPHNTLHIPNGKQFLVTLPDGTEVWLNTASTLTYPIAFSGDDRVVSLDGEAYFEVAHNPSKPFKVRAHGTEITVTGTHFNVSAYPSDEKVVTTLVEGGVDVRKGDAHVSLTPGYEATISTGTETIEKHKANIEQTIAWKNGYFAFDDMDAVSVMRSVARWYDVQLSASGEIPDKHFSGSFPITAGLDELLADLEMVGKIKFERKGKEVRIIW